MLWVFLELVLLDVYCIFRKYGNMADEGSLQVHQKEVLVIENDKITTLVRRKEEVKVQTSSKNFQNSQDDLVKVNSRGHSQLVDQQLGVRDGVMVKGAYDVIKCSVGVPRRKEEMCDNAENLESFTVDKNHDESVNSYNVEDIDLNSGFSVVNTTNNNNTEFLDHLQTGDRDAEGHTDAAVKLWDLQLHNTNTCDSPQDFEPNQLSTAEAKRLAFKRRRTTSGDSRSSSVADDFGHEFGGKSHRSSMVDALLFEIYDRWHSFDSDTFTECSSTSDAFLGRTDSVRHELEEQHGVRISKTFLETKDKRELREMVLDMQRHITSLSARLVRQLKHRDRRLAKVQKHCDIVTAILQASSLKRRVDSKIRFSIDPLPGADAFCQWKDAMRAVARLPLGIPSEFRRKVWLSLADNHLNSLRIDWNKTKRFAFNERSNPDDNKLGLQIVKDLHRTGCSGFSGHDNEEERALLKRVLLAYARWNKQVGYCQGFNVLAALILDVVDRREDDALKVMIYLIDHVLPTSYFTNNLRALSVDMAVFRDLLNVHVPDLSRHLDYLQKAARDDTTGANYEPPLTNVFTMQWFLTLFATCLPKDTALRVWDSVLLEGSEILLRTALSIWDTLKQRIMEIDSADEFYSTMGILTQEMLDCVLIDADQLIKTIYSMGEFPFPQLVELREKYTYNITPFSAAMSTGGQRSKRTAITNIFSDDDELEDEEMMENIGCFTAMFPMSGQTSPSRNKTLSDSDRSSSSYDISKVSPGAYGVTPEQLDLASVYAERMSLDLYALKQQYRKVRQRQKQAHIMLTAANARHQANINKTSKYSPKLNTVTPPIHSPIAVNHLFLGRDMRKQMKSHGKNRAIVEAPNIAPLYGGDVVPASYNVKSPQNRTNKTRTASTTQSKRETFSLLSKHNVEKLQKHMGMMERAGSVVSLDSEVSATSVSDYTKGSNSTVNDSMSDVSTVCGDSSETDEPGDLRPTPRSLLNEGSTVKSGIDSKSRSPQKEAHPVSNEIDSRQDCDVETSKKAVVGDEETETTGDVVKSDEILRQSQVIHADIKQDVDNQSCTEDTNSQQHNGECGRSVETPHIHQLGNVVERNTSSVNQDVHTAEGQSHKTDVTVGSKPTLLHLSQQVTDHCEENTSIKSGVNIVSNSDAPLKHIKPQPAGADATNSASDNTGNYSSKTTKPRSMVRHHHIHQDNSQTMVENIPTQSSAGSTQVRTEQSKVFNPFPSHYISKRRAENGVKLGLYAADNIPKLEVGMYKSGVLKPIGRAHINACLHRQYMEDVRQSAKTSKR